MMNRKSIPRNTTRQHAGQQQQQVKHLKDEEIIINKQHWIEPPQCGRVQ